MAEDEPSVPPSFGRPLPHVGIPLLREQRQAATRKRIVVGILLVLAIAGLVAGSLGYIRSRHAPRRPHSPPVADAGVIDAIDGSAGDAGIDGGSTTTRFELPTEHVDAQTAAPVTPGAVSRRAFAFGTNAVFRTALVNATLSRNEAAAVETALTGVVDFRRCRPEHQLVVERGADNALVRFEYRTSDGASDYAAVVRARDGSLHGDRVQIPVERIRIAKGARVTTTVGDALQQLGLRDSLVAVFVDAFRGRADFGHDTRAGDTFRIIIDEERIHGRFVRYSRAYALEYVGAATGHLKAYWFATNGTRGQYYDGDAREMHGSWLVVPLRYVRLSSPFDMHRLHPVLRRVTPHNGTDFAAPTGTPVWAAAAGTISWAGPKGPNGNLVSIQHDGGYTTHYAHLSRITPGIVRGAHVAQRQSIGQVGTTGRSTGPHLHFGLKLGSQFLDPMSLLNGPGRTLNAAALAVFRRSQRALDRELAGIDVQ